MTLHESLFGLHRVGYSYIQTEEVDPDSFSIPLTEAESSRTSHVNQPGSISPACWTVIRCALLWYRYVDRILRDHVDANVGVRFIEVYSNDANIPLTTWTDSSITSSKIHVLCSHSSVYLSLFQLSE